MWLIITIIHRQGTYNHREPTHFEHLFVGAVERIQSITFSAHAMAAVHNSLISQSDAIVDGILSAEGCHIVLEMSPPDYVEKISRYLESSVGQNKQDLVSNEPAEEER